MSEAPSHLDVLVGHATRRAAVLLEATSKEKGTILHERDLEASLLKSLTALGSPAVANRTVPIPSWQPQPGGTDLLIPSLESPRALAELKWCSDNKVFEAMWDLLKMAWASEKEGVEAAYLIYGAPQRFWTKPVECAREIFFADACDSAALIRRHLDWWKRYILPEGTARPQFMPPLIHLRPIAEPTLDIAGEPWQLRAVGVVPSAGEPIPFHNELPPERLGTDGIESRFNERFEHWQIRLPQEDIIGRRPGHIFEAGWHVGYIWGEDEGEPYLELFAQHRMTSDSHERIHASGCTERLEAPSSGVLSSPEESPVEKEERRRVDLAHNERIYEELRAKGLLPPKGHNLSAHEINEYLRSGGDPSEG